MSAFFDSFTVSDLPCPHCFDECSITINPLYDSDNKKNTSIGNTKGLIVIRNTECAYCMRTDRHDFGLFICMSCQECVCHLHIDRHREVMAKKCELDSKHPSSSPTLSNVNHALFIKRYRLPDKVREGSGLDLTVNLATSGEKDPKMEANSEVIVVQEVNNLGLTLDLPEYDHQIVCAECKQRFISLPPAANVEVSKEALDGLVSTRTFKEFKNDYSSFGFVEEVYKAIINAVSAAVAENALMSTVGDNGGGDNLNGTSLNPWRNCVECYHTIDLSDKQRFHQLEVEKRQFPAILERITPGDKLRGDWFHCQQQCRQCLRTFADDAFGVERITNSNSSGGKVTGTGGGAATGRGNNWMCLTCGEISCPRKEAGGQGHALAHYTSTKHPIVVKLGTIIPHSVDDTTVGSLLRYPVTADLYCYDCDNEIIDFQLADHLAYFGIDAAKCKKSSMSLGELAYLRTLRDYEEICGANDSGDKMNTGESEESSTEEEEEEEEKEGEKGDDGIANSSSISSNNSNNNNNANKRKNKSDDKDDEKSEIGKRKRQKLKKPFPSALVSFNHKTGIHNFGNTCYMGSVFQLLMSTEPFQRRFRQNSFININGSHLGTCGDKRPRMCFECQWVKMVDSVFSGKFRSDVIPSYCNCGIAEKGDDRQQQRQGDGSRTCLEDALCTPLLIERESELEKLYKAHLKKLSDLSVEAENGQENDRSTKTTAPGTNATVSVKGTNVATPSLPRHLLPRLHYQPLSEIRGITPRDLRVLCSNYDKAFLTFNQQDASEYLDHLLSLVHTHSLLLCQSKANSGNGNKDDKQGLIDGKTVDDKQSTSSVDGTYLTPIGNLINVSELDPSVSFELENIEKRQCSSCQRVKYNRTKNALLSVNKSVNDAAVNFSTTTGGRGFYGVRFPHPMRVEEYVNEQQLRREKEKEKSETAEQRDEEVNCPSHATKGYSKDGKNGDKEEKKSSITVNFGEVLERFLTPSYIEASCDGCVSGSGDGGGDVSINNDNNKKSVLVITNRVVNLPEYLAISMTREYFEASSMSTKKMEVRVFLRSNVNGKEAKPSEPFLFDFKALRGETGGAEAKVSSPYGLNAPPGTSSGNSHLKTSEKDDPSPSEVDEECLAILLSMGIEPEVARWGLIATRKQGFIYNSEAAIDYIFSHDYPGPGENKPPPQASSSASADNNRVNNSAAAVDLMSYPLSDDLDNTTYQLVGMISHLGSSACSGHYVCHLLLTESELEDQFGASKGLSSVKDNTVEKISDNLNSKPSRFWYLFNDDKVQKVARPPFELAHIYLFHRVKKTN